MQWVGAAAAAARWREGTREGAARWIEGEGSGEGEGRGDRAKGYPARHYSNGAPPSGAPLVVFFSDSNGAPSSGAPLVTFFSDSNGAPT